MNTRILLTLFFALMMICSVSAVQASDVNITDDSTLSSDVSDNIELESDEDSELDLDDGDYELESDEDSELDLDDGDYCFESNESELEGADDLDSVDSNNLSATDVYSSLSYSEENQTEFTSPTKTTYYKGSYAITLLDSNTGSPLANQAVSFVINNVRYTSVTDSNGIASINLSLKPGTYSVTCCYDGNGTYQACNFTSTFKVLATIQSSDFTKYYKGSTNYKATFVDSKGNPLSNRNVVITLNGKSYTKKTNSKGVVSLSVNLAPGTYKVVATDPVTGYKLTTTVKILSTIKGNNLYKVYLDGKKFVAKFYKSNGKVLANKYVKLKINGKTYKVKTTSYGNAKLSLKSLKKGTYTIKCYNTDGLTKSYKVKVYKKVKTTLTTSYYTFYKNQTKVIKATLTNSLGYAPPSGKIIKFTVNGKTYTRKTNSNGVASLKLPSLKKGVYTFKCKFSGTGNYKASSVSKKVTVITSKYTKLTVKSTKTFGYGADTPFKLAVTAGDVPLVKKTVKFKVNGKTYSRTTDSKGIASLTIKLKPGNYDLDYSVAKTSKTTAKSGSSDIKVVNRTTTALTWKSATTFKGTSQTIKVLLKDYKCNVVSGQTVKLTVNSKTYSATTSSKGYATFKTSVPIGKFTVKVSFAGSNKYLGKSMSKSITVTVSKSIKGVNQANTISNLAAYLKASTHCQVGNSKIKALVTKLTKGLTTEYDKAKAIYNYVRDNLGYSFYYDTKYGAVGTLNAMKGNCVDHSHLLIAMFRTAGLAARYVHGTCTFTSGTYGHVWAQVLIGNTWVVADATSSRNSLGSVNNWNVNSYSLKGCYASISF